MTTNDDLTAQPMALAPLRPLITIVREPAVVTAPARDIRAKTPAPSSAFDAKLLRRVLRVQTQSHHDERMRDFLFTRLPRYPGVREITEIKGNIYVTKGEATVYPCIAAHLDSVHALIPARFFMVEQEGDMLYGWNAETNIPHGIGGDDKVGIYIALEALRMLPAAKLVFFRDEEKGCLGANEADLHFFDDCAFVLEADRRGNADVIMRANSQSLFNDDFKTAIAPYLTLHNFETSNFGMNTDVVALRRRKLDLCTLNASCGYWDPHLSKEYVTMGDVERALRLFMDIAVNLGDQRWLHGPEPVAPAFTSNYQHHRPVTNQKWLEEKERPKVWDSSRNMQVDSIDRNTFANSRGEVVETPSYFRDRWDRWVRYVEEQSAEEIDREMARLKALRADEADGQEALAHFRMINDSTWLGYRRDEEAEAMLPVRCLICEDETGACNCHITEQLSDDETQLVARTLLHAQSNVELIEEQDETYTIGDAQIIEGIRLGAIVPRAGAPTCPLCEDMGFLLYDTSSDEWLCIACRTYLNEGD